MCVYLREGENLPCLQGKKRKGDYFFSAAPPTLLHRDWENDRAMHLYTFFPYPPPPRLLIFPSIDRPYAKTLTATAARNHILYIFRKRYAGERRDDSYFPAHTRLLLPTPPPQSRARDGQRARTNSKSITP